MGGDTSQLALWRPRSGCAQELKTSLKGERKEQKREDTRDAQSAAQRLCHGKQAANPGSDPQHRKKLQLNKNDYFLKWEEQSKREKCGCKWDTEGSQWRAEEAGM